ncbi:hypothetical protein JKA74_12695 [Marivirga sp. S37H4]|uniref:Uncharacterized protein n=1 Tax=Marivirga aurantiaca TaxID=2802615 RepID=A0A934WZ66_9BACT|nr:hypothetical protein [Marivirga aurantiaca]MBK6265893.1 hypothetical protein [Marivirga aurantiaca]
MNRLYRRLAMSVFGMFFCIVSISICNQIKKGEKQSVLTKQEITNPDMYFVSNQ